MMKGMQLYRPRLQIADFVSVGLIAMQRTQNVKHHNHCSQALTPEKGV